jgi:hypothetical protein
LELYGFSKRRSSPFYSSHTPKFLSEPLPSPDSAKLASRKTQSSFRLKFLFLACLPIPQFSYKWQSFDSCLIVSSSQRAAADTTLPPD